MDVKQQMAILLQVASVTDGYITSSQVAENLNLSHETARALIIKLGNTAPFYLDAQANARGEWIFRVRPHERDEVRAFLDAGGFK